MKIIYLDGQYLKVNAQIIDTFTPGSFNAKGVFETMLGLGSFVLDAGLHLDRLRAGLRVLEINPPSLSPSVLKEVLQRNQLSSARVRIMVWQAGKKTHVMVAAVAYQVPTKQKYRVCLLETDRTASDRFANVKSLNYEGFAQAYAQAQAQGFDEALLLNNRGHIFEASRANIFWTKGKALYTPPLSSGCLNGITRQQVIKQAMALKIPIDEKNLIPAILKGADTAFLTSSLLGIKPIDVTSISNIKIA